jgi:hypothetical protein
MPNLEILHPRFAAGNARSGYLCGVVARQKQTGKQARQAEVTVPVSNLFQSDAGSAMDGWCVGIATPQVSGTSPESTQKVSRST